MERAIARVEEFEAASIGQLKNEIAKIAKQFGTRQIILLNGPMGIGKTQTIRCLADVCGAEKEAVCSPTFAFHYQYLLEKYPSAAGANRESPCSLDHLDLYRVESDEDLESIGFWDLFSREEGWIAIEWAERVALTELPIDWPLVSLNFSLMDDQATRKCRCEFYAAD